MTTSNSVDAAWATMPARPPMYGLPGQLSLAELAKEVGTCQAVSSKPYWSLLADAWLEAQPLGATFTSEDLVEAIGLPTDEAGMNLNNAVGGKFAGWAKRHMIVRLGYRPSTTPRNHGAVIAVWRRA